jgi:NTE family protein
MHRIAGGAALQALPGASRASADGAMIRQLCEAGRGAAREWLAQHFEAIGQHATVDIRRDYLDDTRMELPHPRSAAPRSVGRGFRPWLARLLRQS